MPDIRTYKAKQLITFVSGVLRGDYTAEHAAAFGPTIQVWFDTHRRPEATFATACVALQYAIENGFVVQQDLNGLQELAHYCNFKAVLPEGLLAHLCPRNGCNICKEIERSWEKCTQCGAQMSDCRVQYCGDWCDDCMLNCGGCGQPLVTVSSAEKSVHIRKCKSL